MFLRFSYEQVFLWFKFDNFEFETHFLPTQTKKNTEQIYFLSDYWINCVTSVSVGGIYAEFLPNIQNILISKCLVKSLNQMQFAQAL